MITVCGRCGKDLGQGALKCSCGGEAIGVLEPGEKPPSEPENRPLRGREVGAKIGEMLFQNSPFASLATAVGYTLGRVLEGKKIISFSKQPPEPKRIDLGSAIFGGKAPPKKSRRKKRKRKPKVSGGGRGGSGES